MAQPHTTVANIVTRQPVRPLIDLEREPSRLPSSKQPVPSTAPRTSISLHAALLSSLRLWLLYRDDALYTRFYYLTGTCIIFSSLTCTN